MQKIDLSQNQTQKIIVDDELLLDHNRDLSKTESNMKQSPKVLIVFIFLATLAGIGTGFGTYKLSANQKAQMNEVVQVPTTGGIKVGDVFGSKSDAFKDNAEGYLEKGGVAGEGSHKLLRIGGESQTVYLTSSVINLDQFAGMQVKVWGETFKGQKAGWLMDVGRVEVVNTQATAPTEE